MATPPTPSEIDALLHELMQRPEQQTRIIPLAIALLLIDKGIITDKEFEVAKEAAERVVIQQIKDNTSASDMKSMLFLNKLLGTHPSDQPQP